MARVVGIDPGTVSFDLYGLEDGRPFLDRSVPSREVAARPELLLELLAAAGPLDLIAGPSGYGLPLVPASAVGDRERFLLTLVRPDERGSAVGVGGLGRLTRLLAALPVPVVFLPGAIHLPTVPEHRKVNRVDLGTPDKVCSAALGIVDQARRLHCRYADTSFILVEAGGAFSAVLAVAGGQVVDGQGGSSGPPGFMAAGALDGEVAYLLGGLSKQTLFSGGAAWVAGQPQPDLPAFLAGVAAGLPECRRAWLALLEGLEKAVAAMRVAVPQPREILLAGRLARAPEFAAALADRLAPVAPVRPLGAPGGAVAKESARGAALLADGLANGAYRELVDVLRLREAAGTALDHIYIPGLAR